MVIRKFILSVIILHNAFAYAQQNAHTVFVADSGWASNSINTVVFRKNALVTFKDTQYIAFYNAVKQVVLGKRQLNTDYWILHTTQYDGNTTDAHNSISIMVDDSGYLHIAWDHHNHPLRYAKSIAPGSLQLTDKLSMTGIDETKVSYPEFYKLPGGKLLFFYRNGASGNGNLVINQYNIKTRQWVQLHNNLINGEGMRNAYWQACTDANGYIHLSWVWRESPDVASNHDMCYALSKDGGVTWQQSNNKKYILPITAATAEYAAVIPQKNELINQTSITSNNKGQIFIATYYKDKDGSIPQYHIIYVEKNKWHIANAGFNTVAFSLSGTGTKRIPISRPQVVAFKNKIVLLFRDEARGGHVTAAICNSIKKNKWLLNDLTSENAGSWEPAYDTELWRLNKTLHLFLQHTNQADGEGMSNFAPQPVKVVEWLHF